MKIRISNSGYRGNSRNSSVGFGISLIKKATLRDVVNYALIFIVFGIIFAAAGVMMIINIQDVVRFLGLIFIIPGILIIVYAIKKIREASGGDTDLYIRKRGRMTSLVDGRAIGYPMRHKDLTSEQNELLERNRQLMMKPGLFLGFLLPLVIAIAIAYFIIPYISEMLLPDGGTITPAATTFIWVVATLVAFIPVKVIINIIYRTTKVIKNI
ncbi:MAG: hypothetical protein R3Y60_00610 [bacterium]